MFNSRMRVLALLIVVLAVSNVSYCAVSLRELRELDLEKIGEGCSVQLTEKSDNDMEQFEKAYYILKTSGKDKKNAYVRMRKVLEKVVKILVKNQIIPDQEGLVESRIKSQHQIKKRHWVFSQIFLVMGTEAELEKTHRQLLRLGVQRLKTKPSMNFLLQKMQTMRLFNKAKSRLAAVLEELGDFEIKEAEQIQIKGIQVQNEELIEEQLEEDFNASEEAIEEEDLIQSSSVQVLQELEIRVRFRVGPRNNQDQHSQEQMDDDDQDEDEEDEEESSQSESI